MRFPDELYKIIQKYKKDFEQRDLYEKRLATFASAVIHKPEMNTLSQKEARQAFCRLFPKYKDYFRYVAKDLEQYLGPPMKMFGEDKVWFLLKDRDYPFFYDVFWRSLDSYEFIHPEQPEHTSV